jgi:hypothetical protein
MHAILHGQPHHDSMLYGTTALGANCMRRAQWHWADDMGWIGEDYNIQTTPKLKLNGSGIMFWAQSILLYIPGITDGCPCTRMLGTIFWAAKHGGTTTQHTLQDNESDKKNGALHSSLTANWLSIIDICFQISWCNHYVYCISSPSIKCRSLHKLYHPCLSVERQHW